MTSISSTISTATTSTLTPTRNLYNGTLKLKIIEAEGLKATDYSTRLFQSSSLSPYINIDVDDLPVGRTSTKQKSCNPVFNEEFELNIKSGYVLHFTVFHDSALLPDEFVANCSVTLDDVRALVDAKNAAINAASNSLNSAAAVNTTVTNPNASDLCIDLEPNGRLHLNVEFEGTFTQGKSP